MLIEYGPAVCTVRGDVGEIEAVRSALTLVIPGQEDDPVYFLTPNNEFLTGFFPNLTQGLRADGWEVEVKDFVDPSVSLEVFRSAPMPVLEGIEWRDYQESMIRKAVLSGRGTIDIATGGGKTEVGAGIIQWYRNAGKADRSLIVVNNVRLLEQTYSRFMERGIRDVGYISGDSTSLDYPIVIGMVQTLSRRMRKDHALLEWLEEVDLLLFDEAHHLPAVTWTSVATSCVRAHYRFGMSATTYDPTDPRPEDWILTGVTGPTIGYVSSWVLRQRGVLAEPEVVMIDYKQKKLVGNQWSKIYKAGIVENERRNEIIVDLAVEESEAGSRVMVFISQITHGLALLGQIQARGVQARFCKGGGEVFDDDDAESAYQQELSEVAEWMQRVGSITIVTSAFDEGLDVADVNCLIFGGGMKKHRRTVQRMGRGLRKKEGQNRCIIYDFHDGGHGFLKKQSRKRGETYQMERINVRRVRR